ILLPVILAEFRFAVFHRVGSFNQVVAKESVAGTNAFGVFGLKRTGLVPAPCQTGILGQGGLVVKTFDVANLSENAGRVNLVDAGDGAKAPGAVHAVQDPLDGFVQLLELSLDATDRLDGDAQHKIDGVFHDLGQPVRVSDRKSVV